MLIRLSYGIYRFFSSLWYRLGRRFTKAGWLVLAGLVMTAGMGLDTEQSAAYQSFAVLFCLLAAAMMCTAIFRGRFVAQRMLPRFGSVGEPLAYKVVIKNQTAKTQAGLTLLETLADPRQTLAEFLERIQPAGGSRSFRLTTPLPNRRQAALKEQPLPSLAPHSETAVSAELTPLKRGPLRFLGIAVARTDPFGLMRGFVKVPLPQSVLILPKRYFIPPIALPGTMRYQRGGVAMASSVGESEEFISLREYRRGDPMRHIHWKSWAKTGRPIVKEFQDEFFVRHALILDTFTGTENEEIFEEAISVAASFACALQTQESLLDLMFVGSQAFCFTTGRGLAYTDQMLEILASVEMCRDKPFGALRSLVVEHVSAVSGCVCILLEWDPVRQDLVRQLQALDLSMMVLVVTKAGSPAQLDPGPMKKNPGCFHVLEIGKIAEGLQKL